jgi:hypothetical protein
VSAFEHHQLDALDGVDLGDFIAVDRDEIGFHS